MDLSEKIKSALKPLSSNKVIDSETLENVLKDIRNSLLDADVNLTVVKDFIKDLRGTIIGKQVVKKTKPKETIIKLIHDQMLDILENNNHHLSITNSPYYIMMVGLQGSGKTTTVAKIANKFKDDKKILLVACDVYRPSAIEQLQVLAKSINADVYSEDHKDVAKIAAGALKRVHEKKYDLVIFDTAGRLHIDENLMDELKTLKSLIKPKEILLTIDSTIGQESNSIINGFHNQLKLTGFIVSKLDSDTRAGVLFNISYLKIAPILYIGTGEAINNLEEFKPERFVKRILGMGDVVGLVEKIQENFDEQSSERLMQKMMNGQMNLNDLVAQLKQFQKMGKLNGLMRMIPGMPKITSEQQDAMDKKIFVIKCLVSSMTEEERRKPKLLKEYSRKNRIIKGSGRSPQEFNLLLKQWDQTQEQMSFMKQQFGSKKFF